MPVYVDRRPEWQLPPGVTAGVWEYTQTDHIAEDYDEYFALNQLFDFDERILAQYFRTEGLVADLGCGTGRALLPLARRGYHCLGIDLSLPMLQVLGRKAAQEGLCIHRLRANLVELDCLADESVEYACCLFSTLGMIHGRENRARFLRHAGRILKPGGPLVLHMHNLWYNLASAAGRRWLKDHLFHHMLRRQGEPGDKFFNYRGIPRMFVHAFTWRDLVHTLEEAGLQIETAVPLHTTRQRPLRWPWLFGRLRANGWIVVCRKPLVRATEK